MKLCTYKSLAGPVVWEDLEPCNKRKSWTIISFHHMNYIERLHKSVAEVVEHYDPYKINITFVPY